MDSTREQCRLWFYSLMLADPRGSSACKCSTLLEPEMKLIELGLRQKCQRRISSALGVIKPSEWAERRNMSNIFFRVRRLTFLNNILDSRVQPAVQSNSCVSGENRPRRIGCWTELSAGLCCCWSSERHRHRNDSICTAANIFLYVVCYSLNSCL